MARSIRRAVARPLKAFVGREVRRLLVQQDDEMRATLHDAVMQTPTVAAKFLPKVPERDQVTRVAGVAPDGPVHERVPPESLRSITGGYESSVQRHVDAITDVLEQVGADLPATGTMLDFGCGTGRLLQGLHHRSGGQGTYWGVDQDAARIEWAQANLSPPMLFTTCTTAPHLPFEDRTFDLVTAGSVFSHISDLADAWLLELLRVTVVGGYLYLTIHDEHWVASLRSGEADQWLVDYLAPRWAELDRLDDAYSIVFDRGHPDAVVVYHRARLLERWARYAEVVGVFEESYDLQTAVVLRKRAGGKLS